MTKTKTESNKVTLTLSNGVKVEFNPKDATGNCLMKARCNATGYDTVILLLSEIALFNGEKMPAPEILNFNAFDIIALEEAWASACPKKQFQMPAS